jgi:hypothetical protein
MFSAAEEFDITTAQTPPNEGFRSLSKANFGMVEGVIWLRITLRNNDNRPNLWYLDLDRELFLAQLLVTNNNLSINSHYSDRPIEGNYCGSTRKDSTTPHLVAGRRIQLRQPFQYS